MACANLDVFGGGVCPNGTTVGEIGESVSLVASLSKLIDYLPSGGTAGKLGNLGINRCFGVSPGGELTGGGSKGSGGGVLTGQALATTLNAVLSLNGFTPGGITGNLSGFSITATVCTKRSGPDKVLDTGDDVTQTFPFPTCVVGKTVGQVLADANHFLAGKGSTLSCSASALNTALSNINVMFDQCGKVVACP